MKQENAYWIWLQQGLGYGSAAAIRVASQYKSLKDFYHGGEREWRLSGLLTPKQLDRLLHTPLAEAEKALERCYGLGYQVLPYGSPQYPALLRQIARPPLVLYLQGDESALTRPVSIAMVGTRDATPYGLQMARYFAGELAKTGVVVVSGGALGIDTASHLGALEAGGKTVAVLGCGINTRYLKENERLRARIAGQGALVSEFPPDTPAKPVHFPMRNRIISGLAQGVLVVEAGVKSGSLITAQDALDEGRDVFAVPGNVNSPKSGGTNALIRTSAKPVSSAADILEEYYGILPDTLTVAPSAPPQVESRREIGEEIPAEENRQGVPEQVKESLSPQGKRLLEVLGREPAQIDELAARAGLSAREALMAATELELLGAAAGNPGKRFALL